MIKNNDFLFDKTEKLKVDWKYFGVGLVINGCGHSGQGTLQLDVSQE